MAFYIGLVADTHIGYRDGKKITDEGVNIREQDGYEALSEIVDKFLELYDAGRLHVVVIAGDLFHTSHPSIRAITWVQFQMRRLAKAEIPVYILAGNHDASDERANIASVAPINDTNRGIYALYKPAARYKIEHPDTDGDIYLHAIAHHGLSAHEAPEITPIDGAVNILTTHGAAIDPKNKILLHCQDSPREQIIPPEIMLNEDINVRLLGHYHTRGEVVPGTYYAGSTLRRGWSDEPGKRGITLFRVEADGKTVVDEYIDIYQRPQYDLEMIDAKGLTSEEIEEQVLANLARTELDAQGNPIQPLLRQNVTNVSPTVRNLINRSLLHKAASHGLTWKLNLETQLFERPDVSEALDLDNRHSFTGQGILKMYDDYAQEYKKSLTQMTEDEQDAVVSKGQEYLKRANEKTEG